MAQSIKFDDNNYMDTAGVWDKTKGTHQEWLNNNFFRTDGTLLLAKGFIRNGQSIQVNNDWSTYLCISSYTTQLGMWLVIPQGSVVFKINGQGSAIDPTVSPGIITSNTQWLLVIRVGMS